MHPENVALCLDSLSKSFGRIRAVRGLSSQVYPGEMVGFLGPNGAGKSTTLYMIARLVHPTDGRVRIFGRDVWRDGRRAMLHAGAMVETPCFYEYLSARKNLELRGRLYPAVNAAQIDSILSQVGLQDRCRDKVAIYSQGMKQRLGVGMALLGDPRLVLLDEPTNGMDPEGTQQMLSFLKRKCRQDGTAVFLSSHLLSEVQEYCDRVIVVDRSVMVDSGRVDEILKPHQNIIKVDFAGQAPDRSTLLKENRIAGVEPGLTDGSLIITLSNRDSAWLTAWLLAQGYKVSALAPRQKTLKEFFLGVTGGSSNAS